MFSAVPDLDALFEGGGSRENESQSTEKKNAKAKIHLIFSSLK